MVTNRKIKITVMGECMEVEFWYKNKPLIRRELPKIARKAGLYTARCVRACTTTSLTKFAQLQSIKTNTAWRPM